MNYYRLRMKKIHLFVALFIFLIPTIRAQESNIHYSVDLYGGYISDNHIPFWLRSNQFGSIPIDNASLSFVGRMSKDFDKSSKKLFDWGASFEGRANIGDKSNFIFIEGYGKLKLSIFELRAGRSKEITGLCDTTLSSGAFAVSGNALGIPKIQISIPEFYSIPIFGKLFAFKGNFAHGWIGEATVHMLNDTIAPLKTYFHQKTFYGRLGKPEWKWKLYGGFSHQVFFGSESDYYGRNYTLTSFERYWYVISGKPYGNNVIPTSKIGNHLGSIDFGFEYNFKNARLFGYHQFVYDIGALGHLANVRDGLSGLSLANTQSSGKRSLKWKKILLEFLYTKNQAGELWSPYTPSGDENYYNSDVYVKGWWYAGNGLGNPLINTRDWAREGLVADPHDYFINNRIIALHLGFEGSVKNWNFILKTSYSMNYGTFGTSEVGHTLGKDRTLPKYGIFTETKQLSSYVETNMDLKKNLKLGIVGAFDVGKLYYNSFGFLLRMSKSF